MQNYSVTCTCGDNMTVQANSMEEAKTKLKEMMTPDMIAKHWGEKHQGQPTPTEEQLEAMLQTVHEG